MPKDTEKIKALRRYTTLCKHIHVSGRRCTIRSGRDGYGTIQMLCVLHKEGDCRDCSAMMAAFPLRKTVQGVTDDR